MISLNTWITITTGSALALGLWGFTLPYLSSASTAYRVEALPSVQFTEGIELLPSLDVSDSETLKIALENLQNKLAQSRSTYETAKSQFGWSESFENLITLDAGKVSAKLPSVLANTDELEALLRQPERMKIRFPDLPFDDMRKPKASEKIGEKWVWIKPNKADGFWICANERNDSPADVTILDVTLKTTSPTKEQWLSAHNLNLSSINNIRDGKAEFLLDGTVIGNSKHLMDHPLNGFDGLQPLLPAERTAKTLGKLSIPSKADQPPQPTTSAVTLQEAITYAKSQLSPNEFNRLLRPDFEKVWIPRLQTAKALELQQNYNIKLQQLDKEHQAAIAEAKKNQAKEDSFAYRWIILPP